jgi:hypothetical protein
MREVLSKTNDVSVPCEELEYYHLHLTDGDDAWDHRFCVVGFLERWDSGSGRMVCEYELNAGFATMEEAKRGYTDHRAAVVKRGFVYSDMDMF